MCFAYHKSYGLDVTIVRPCNVYGERQRSGRGGALIPIFASLAAAGKPLTVFGSGEQRREYVHVSDLANAYDLVLQRSDLAGATLNVGTGDTPSVKEIARAISDRMGVSIVNEPARSGEVSGFELDSSKIRQLGFTPHVKFWDGLSAYLAGRDAVPIDSAH
jgi:dTDP-glucose 4,6-dehydratase